MHLSSLLPWLVVAGLVVGHPAGLVARASDDERRVNNGENGGGNLLTNPATYISGGVGLAVGALAAKSPDIYRWYQNRPPGWYTKMKQYIQQTPEERHIDRHRLLMEVKFSDDELNQIATCTRDQFRTWMDVGDFDQNDQQHVGMLTEKAHMDCRLEYALRKMRAYETAQAQRQQTQSQRSSGDRNLFSLNEVKLPSVNLAAVGPALNKAASHVAQAKPRLMKVG